MTDYPGTDVLVVLNWFGRTDTLDCVASLRDGSPEAVVLVVDNGSFDGTLAEVAAQWPEVQVLQLETNRGFTGGMNAGLRWAIARNAATVTVLNNDTLVPPGVICALASHARGADVAVSPRIRRRAEPTSIWFAAGGIDAHTGLPQHLPPSDIPAHGATVTDILAGCCVTASRETWVRVGLFDEWFYLNFEDSEWSIRARRRGVTLMVDQDVVIDHAVSASFIGVSADLGLYYYTRNGLRFIRRDCGRSWLTALRFLRGHVLPSVRAPWDAGRRADAARCAVLVGWGAASFAANQGGRAPRSLERMVRRWRSAAMPRENVSA